MLYLTKAADYFDLKSAEHTDESLNDLRGNRSKFLIISYTSDWLYPTYQARELVQGLKRSGQDVSFCEIEADCGHDAFLIQDTRLTKLIKGFLDGLTVS